MVTFSPTRRALLGGAGLALTGLALVPRAGAAEPPLMVVLGDSLSAGYGLPPEEAFPVKLAGWLKQQSVAVRIQNASVSGDTTAGGRARLGWALADKPDYLLLELGANDALRGTDPRETRANLDAILAELKSKGIKALMLGMLAPPNFGKAYGEAFNAIYPDLAKQYGVPLYPFFLDGVALDTRLNQPDRLHPNPQGVAILVERVGPVVKRWLQA